MSDAVLRDRAALVARVATLKVPEWTPKDNVKLVVDKEDKATPGEADEADVVAALGRLPAPSAVPVMVPQEFEKDDATNFHMDFIHSVANLRAANYGIPVGTQIVWRPFCY